MGSQTDLGEFFGELGAGMFQETVESILSEVAMAVMVHGTEKPCGALKIDLSFSKVSETEQLGAVYKLSYTKPTNKGKKSEEIRGSSIYFVGKGGKVCVEAPQEHWSGQVEMFSG